MKRVLLIVVDVDYAKETGAINELHAAVKAHYSEWWHHMTHAYMVRTDESIEAVVAWLNRVWREGHPASRRAIITELGKIDGFLPSTAWEWLKKTEKEVE